MRWPDVARVPGGPLGVVSGSIADRLLRRAAARLPLRLRYPDGSVVGAADPTLPTLVIHRPDALARSIGRYGLIGFGESYMAGEWSSEDLVGVLTELAKSVTELVPAALQRLRPIAVVGAPRTQHNSPAQARRNVSAHYDLSNDLFAEFLDETMTYSSALFDSVPATPHRLADAQRRKMDRLLDIARVGPGSRVLEIGTGWGELCIRAAARGAQIRSVTLSAEQQHLAQQRVAAAGLSDRVQIELRDYRDVDGRYDAVLSVEMVEAVGYRFWPTYFRTLERLVAPGGRVAIQAITMPHDRMLATRDTYTWIQKYIFPGGLLPSTEAIIGITERHTRLRTVDMLSLRPHYAETLRLWREKVLPTPGRGGGVGFRRRLPADVGALPGLLRGGFPQRISRRVPVGLRTDRRWTMNLLVVSVASLAILVVVHGITFLIGRRIGRYNVVDIAWGLGFVAVAAVAAALGTGDLFRRILLLALVSVWGLRLAWHMYVKSAGKGEDPRYRDLLDGDFSAGHVVRKIFVIQAAATWFVSLPLQLSAVQAPTPVALWPVLIAGVALWGVGVAFEARRRSPAAAFQIRPGQQGSGDGPRPVGMDAASQLLRRRMRVVGVVAGDHHRLAVAVDGGLTFADDLLPGVRHRRTARPRSIWPTALASANIALAHRFSCRGRPDCDYHDDARGCG